MQSWLCQDSGKTIWCVLQQREFTAPNPNYGVQPKARKHLKFPLQCLFGPKGTKLKAKDITLVTAVAGLPMTSASALRALCGKPGAAKKALGELDAENVHARSAAAAMALGDGVAESGGEGSGEGSSGEEGAGASVDQASTKQKAKAGRCAGDSCLSCLQIGILVSLVRPFILLLCVFDCSVIITLLLSRATKMKPKERQKVADQLGLGLLYHAFDDHAEGLEACAAVEALIEISAIETLRSAFLLPLQGGAVKAERVR